MDELHKRTGTHSVVCLVGDLNAKVPDYFPAQQTDPAGKRLLHFANCQGLTQVVSEPTHGLEASPSLLDVLFLNQTRVLHSSRVLPPFTDHCPTSVKLQLSGYARRKPHTYFTPDYAQADFDGLRNSLS